MKIETSNGQTLHEGVNNTSPFSQILALGWDDGPTQGLVRAVDCVWKFDRVDEIHNPDGLDLRLFALAPLPLASWDQMVAVLSLYQKPNWPIWLPLWQFPTDAETQSVNRAMDYALAAAGPVEWLVAAEDLFGEIAAAKNVTQPKPLKFAHLPSFMSRFPTEQSALFQ